MRTLLEASRADLLDATAASPPFLEFFASGRSPGGARYPEGGENARRRDVSASAPAPPRLASSCLGVMSSVADVQRTQHRQYYTQYDSYDDAAAAEAASTHDTRSGDSDSNTLELTGTGAQDDGLATDVWISIHRTAGPAGALSRAVAVLRSTHDQQRTLHPRTPPGFGRDAARGRSGLALPGVPGRAGDLRLGGAPGRRQEWTCARARGGIILMYIRARLVPRAAVAFLSGPPLVCCCCCCGTGNGATLVQSCSRRPQVAGLR